MYKTLKTIFIVSLLVGMVFLAGCSSEISSLEQDEKITVYKSPQCGCCSGHVAELKKKGFDVEIKETGNIQLIKQKYNIPQNMASCHTTVIGNYVVEGHVPLEAIDKLLTEKPDIDGIALPGMPAGSPGMPGTKRGEWTIYALKDGKFNEFMKV